MKQRFFKCAHCGNIIAFVENKGVPVICCGEPMQEILPGTTDAATEKHVPVIQIDGTQVTVTVGETLHPMQEEHFIQWISLETKQGNQRKELNPGDQPVAKFALCADDEVVCAFAYCNLHGLWKSE